MQSSYRHCCPSVLPPWPIPVGSLVPPKDSLVTLPGEGAGGSARLRSHAVFLGSRGCAALAQRGAAQRPGPPGAPRARLRDPHGAAGAAAAGAGGAGQGCPRCPRCPRTAPAPHPAPGQRQAQPREGHGQRHRRDPGRFHGNPRGSRLGTARCLPQDYFRKKTSLGCPALEHPGAFQAEGMTWLQLKRRKGRRCS